MHDDGFVLHLIIIDPVSNLSINPTIVSNEAGVTARLRSSSLARPSSAVTPYSYLICTTPSEQGTTLACIPSAPSSYIEMVGGQEHKKAPNVPPSRSVHGSSTTAKAAAFAAVQSQVCNTAASEAAA
jgi:hypothetical protein